MPGDRVAWFYHPGSYADLAAVRTDSLVKMRPAPQAPTTSSAPPRAGFQDQVREPTGGRGADVVYDNGGTVTFRSSQLALRRHGVHAFYGNLIGNPTLNPTDLPASIKLTYPVVFDHVPDPARLRQRAGEVFDLVAAGKLTPRIGARYPARRRREGPRGPRLAPHRRQPAAHAVTADRRRHPRRLRAIGQRPATAAGRWSARRCRSPIAWSSATRRW